MHWTTIDYIKTIHVKQAKADFTCFVKRDQHGMVEKHLINL